MKLSAAEEAALAELVFVFSGPHSQKAVAAHLGWSQAKVSRVEARALKKLRRLAKDWHDGLREPVPDAFSFKDE